MLSDKINSLPISQTVAMTAKAHDLKNQGIDVITLSAGEPDFDTPEYIKKDAKKAIDSGETKYTAVDGTADLKKAIVRKFKNENNLDYSLDEIKNILSASGDTEINFVIKSKSLTMYVRRSTPFKVFFKYFFIIF